jgi:hypothetical protein
MQKRKSGIFIPENEIFGGKNPLEIPVSIYNPEK